MDKEKMTALVSKAQQGDSQALEKLLEGCYKDLYYFALKTVKDENLASDITQESCIEIMTTLEKLREPAAFSVWAHQITYHQCTRHFRQTQELQFEETEDGESILDVLPDESDSSMPDQVYENKEFQQTMQDMLNELPAEQRSALLLYYYEKMSVRQIADIHGTTEGTIKSRLNYGRKAVKKQVEDYEKKNNVKLHSIAPLPLLLYWLFRLGAEEASQSGTAAALGTALGAAGTAGAASGTAAGSSAAAGAAAGKAASSAAVKIIAGILAAGVTAGAVWGGTRLIQNQSDPLPNGAVTDPTTEPTASTAPAPVHVHDFDYAWECTDTTHRQVCACGEMSEPEAHTYDADQVCTVCGYSPVSQGLEYLITDGECWVRGIGTCTDSDIVIPAEYGGYPVTTISVYAFLNCAQITSVTLPDTVTTIGVHAFNGCVNLSSIQPGSGLTKIGEYAFNGCAALEEITFPGSLTEIGEYAFCGCTSLRSIALPEGLVTLGPRAFRDCSDLVSIVIPGSLETFGEWVFAGCTSLSDVALGNGLAAIGSSAFENCAALTRITLPDSLTAIGSYAFYGCTSLTEITIPSGVTELSSSVFENCTALTAISLPSGITSIGARALRGCTGLAVIRYAGTTAQWAAIEKSNVAHSYGWDYDTNEYTIRCIDGNIAKEDT